MLSEKPENDIKIKDSTGTTCNARTKSGKFMATVALILVIIACTLSIIIIAILKIHRTENICFTLGCVKTAQSVLQKANFSIDPCDDFYEYACGNFLKTKVIAPDKSSVNLFNEVSDIISEQIKIILTNEEKEDLIRPFELVKNFYKSCMNTSAIEKLGQEPIHAIADDVGGWPVLKSNSWNEYTWNLEDTILKLENIGLDSTDLFILGVEIDEKNSSNHMIYIDEPLLHRKFLMQGLENDIVRSYLKFSIDSAVLFGANRKRAEKELQESLDFEMLLAKITTDEEDRRNMTELYNLVSLYDISSRYRHLNWVKIFSGVLKKSISLDEIVRVANPTFFKNFDVLISRTPRRTIANYLMWKTYLTSMPYLTEDLQIKEFELKSILMGNEERKSRWEECISQTKNYLTPAVASMYVRKYFPESSKKAAVTMVERIQKAFNDVLTNIEWMDQKTRELALKKLEKMAVHIAYPDELINDNKLIEHYRKLQLNENYYFGNILQINKFDNNNYYNKLNQRVNKTDWRNHIYSVYVNAYYHPAENSISFPAGILQNDFFSNDRPNYMNYGGIGHIIGHEMTHGFDYSGAQYNWDGSLSNWWAENTKNAYLKKTQGFIEQYDNFIETTTGQKINGNLTQDENIADNGGIKQAYFAYSNWVEENGIEPKLPGLQNFTSNQMFWISVAQIYCSKERIETTKSLLLVNSHSPARFRVMGSLQNNKEFSTDFQCSVGSQMNPSKKYEVW